MDIEISKIGKELVEASANAKFTAQRSVINELFPYIYVASKRMSMRAISKWLRDHHDIEISAVAVARAMRDQEKHWDRMANAIEPAARLFADAHSEHYMHILTGKHIFEHEETKPPDMEWVMEVGETKDGYEYTVSPEVRNEYMEAVRTLRNQWFNLPEEIRAQCHRHLAFSGLGDDYDEDEDE